MSFTYPKIVRLPLFSVPYRKRTLGDNEIDRLFCDEVVVEEKIDGKQAYSVEDNRYVVFYEYMRIRHELSYNRLPSFKIAFDVYSIRRKMFLGLPEKHRILESLGYCYVPVLYRGKINSTQWRKFILEIMDRKSLYGDTKIEGVVIKNYKKQFFAKAINKEFDEAVRGKQHYMRTRYRKESENKLVFGNS